MNVDELARRVDALEQKLKLLETPGYWSAGWEYLRTPKTSTSWDGDAYSTTAKTLIDLHAVFGTPKRIRAVLLRLAVRDSASAAAAGTTALIVSPNNTVNAGMYADCSGLPNDVFVQETVVVPCDEDGNIYYQTLASGAGTLDVHIQVWGYMK